MKVKMLNPNAKVPTRCTAQSVGLDLYSPVRAWIEPWGSVKIGMGLALELPRGSWAQIAPRSSLSANGLLCHTGVIDSDYRGEVVALLQSLTGASIEVEVGDRIAQLILHQHYYSEIEVVEELSETLRGAGGLGSTGR